MTPIPDIDGSYTMVVFPGAISLPGKLNAARNKAHASKGKLEKICAVQKDKTDVEGGGEANTSMSMRKPRQQHAKETDWSKSSCAVVNFPPFKDKSLRKPHASPIPSKLI